MSPPKRILIVDDEPNVRLVFRTALESTGHHLETASEGQEALDRLRRAPVDLVLLDLKMPRMDGMETLRRLRAAGNNVPVVIITAHGSIPDAVEAMRLGAIDFLSKPLTPESLRQIVELVFQRYAPEQEAPEPPRAAPVVVTMTSAVLNLSAAKRAINRREFDEACDLLEEAIEQFPTAAEAHTLLGVLYECQGRSNAAFHAYRNALKADRHYQPALDNLRRYCELNKLDFTNAAINPAAK